MKEFLSSSLSASERCALVFVSGFKPRLSLQSFARDQRRFRPARALTCGRISKRNRRPRGLSLCYILDRQPSIQC
jgi:hypothetical protein